MLSSVEMNEKLRSIGFARRAVYSLLVAFSFVADFFLTMLLSVAIALLLTAILLRGEIELPFDALIIGMPVVIAFFIAVGLLGLGSQEGVTPGQNITGTAWAGLRRGLIGGLVVGVIFGFLWALVLHTTPPVYAALVGLSLGPALGLFRAVASIIEPASLTLVAGRP